MRIVTREIALKTSGQGDMLNITDDLRIMLKEVRMKEGQLLVFALGSTFSVTAFEYEPGLMKDMKDLYARLVPQDRVYAHNDSLGDGNGVSHLRSALQGQSLAIPFKDGKLLLGTWQQIVVAEFDLRPRTRQVAAQFMGE